MPIDEYIAGTSATPVPASPHGTDAQIPVPDVRAGVAAPARLVAVATVLASAPLPSPELQSLVTMLRETHGALIAGVSIVAPDRQTYVAIDGMDLEYTQVRDELSFCALVVSSGQPLAVPDALHDERFKLTPGVTDRIVAAYVGVPVWVDGQAVGSLCLYGGTPGDFDSSSIPSLTVHARVVSTLLHESRRADRDAPTGSERRATPPPGGRGSTRERWPDLVRFTRRRRDARGVEHRDAAPEPS